MFTLFGKEIRKMRLDRGMILKVMAELLDVSPAFLSAVETGRKAIPSDFVSRIAIALNLTPDLRQRLQEAAELSAKEFRIPMADDASDRDRCMVASFARQFPALPEDVKMEISQILERTRG